MREKGREREREEGGWIFEKGDFVRLWCVNVLPQPEPSCHAASVSSRLWGSPVSLTHIRHARLRHSTERGSREKEKESEEERETETAMAGGLSWFPWG